MTRKSSLAFLFCLALVFASASGASSLDPAKLGQIDAAVQTAMNEHRLPGAVVWVEHGGDIYGKAYGKRSLVPSIETMTRDTIFDVASLTKVLATTPAIMLLVQRGQVNLDAAVATCIPEFTGEKSRITVRQLMTHTSGLPGGVNTKTKWQGTETAIKMAAGMKLEAAPGTAFNYSDINFFILGEMVARVSGMSLDKFCAKEIYRPLKMTETGFLPPRAQFHRIAPTQMTDGGLLTDKTNGVMLRGTVHDPTARFMGGVAGNAGLFSTAPDMARFARMMLNLGELDGRRIFQPDTVKLMTSVQTPPGMADRRGLGWDIDSAYSSPRGQHFPPGSYGHTGFTGDALWIDPFSRTFFIFLSNRVHPYGGSGAVTALYREIGTLAAEAVTDFNFAQAVQDSTH
jgi:CubicO group peptidase (beta-lactamase class C family)